MHVEITIDGGGNSPDIDRHVHEIEVHEVVLDLRRPVRGEAVFQTGTDHPAGCGVPGLESAVGRSGEGDP